MRLYAQQGFRGKVIDLDTGLEVPRVIWLDTDAGLVEAYRVVNGKPVKDATGAFKTYTAKGRFKFVPHTPTAKSLKLGSDRCTRCQSPLVLMGSELCPRCNAIDRSYKLPSKVESIVTNPSLFLLRGCDHGGCSRGAQWSVSDEVIVTPQKSGRRYYERGMTVAQRFYCSFHYAPPRLLDEKGDVVETFEEAGGVRPQ